MSTLGKAVILFGADTTLFRGDVGKAVAIFQSGVNSMTRAADTFGAKLTGALSVGGIVLFTERVLDAAEALGKLKEKTGISVETLSGWKLGADLANISSEGFEKGLRDFNRTLVEATDQSSKSARVMRAMGVDISQGPTVAFRQFADAFAKLPEGELRTAAAMEVLKRGGAEWIPLLAQGSKGLDDAAEKAKNLGLIVSDQFAQQAEQFNTNMKLLRSGSTALANSLLKDALPGLIAFTTELEKGAERGEKAMTFWQQLKQINAMTLPASDPLSRKELNPNETLITAMMQGRLSSGKIKGATPGSDFVGDLPLASDVGPDAEAVRKALAETEGLYKRQAAAIQMMEDRKRSLFDLDEQQLMLLRVTEGSYKDFDSTTKVRLLNMALEIDERRQLLEQGRLDIEAMTTINNGRERGEEIYRAFLLAGRQDLEQRDYEITLLGKSSRQQEILNALHQIDLNLLQQRRAAAQAYGEDYFGLEKEQARLETEASRQREEAIRQIKRRQDAEREWSIGARAAWHEYADAASNAAAEAQMLWSDAFRGAEDALVNFVKNGKLNFSSLADSIIADLTRIAVRRAILGPMADWLLGGSGAAGPWASLGAATDNFGAGFGAGADTLGVGAAPYAAGGRYSAGGVKLVGEHGPELMIPDSGGEVVSTSALRRALGGGRQVYMPVYIQTPDPGSFRASSGQIARDLAAAARRVM